MSKKTLLLLIPCLFTSCATQRGGETKSFGEGIYFGGADGLRQIPVDTFVIVGTNISVEVYQPLKGEILTLFSDSIKDDRHAAQLEGTHVYLRRDHGDILVYPKSPKAAQHFKSERTTKGADNEKLLNVYRNRAFLFTKSVEDAKALPKNLFDFLEQEEYAKPIPNRLRAIAKTVPHDEFIRIYSADRSEALAKFHRLNPK